jgi:hypothetical protein
VNFWLLNAVGSFLGMNAVVEAVSIYGIVALALTLIQGLLLIGCIRSSVLSSKPWQIRFGIAALICCIVSYVQYVAAFASGYFFLDTSLFFLPTAGVAFQIISTFLILPYCILACKYRELPRSNMIQPHIMHQSLQAVQLQPSGLAPRL